VNPRDFIRYITTRGGYKKQIVHVQRIPARAGRPGKLNRPLPIELQQALTACGILQLYTHQAQAINAIAEGRHVITATSAASGKTLIYNLPVLQSCLEDPRSRAFYLFPTKALAQDQLRALDELCSRLPRMPQFGTYDGDTPRGARQRLRRSAQIILTNPDMLHLGILPNHALWSRFLSNLRYVVIDEAHVYRGIFGSQVACILRRLQRLCQFYGANPQFVLCSATIANPEEHGQRLTGEPMEVISDDGSPHGPREFVLWNPPFIDAQRSARRSANVEATALLVEMVQQGLRSITFTRARRVAELILLYARELLAEEAPELVSLIRSYRAGYRPELRREIEEDLFSGHLLGVTATSALELGVDVGHLDATILVGFPGTIASTWQQAGRAGRGTREALNILIGLDNPLDQYFMRHPEALFGSSPEHALVAPDNVHVLRMHLPCAAYERPLSTEDEELFGGGYVEAMIELEREGTIEYRMGRWFYTGLGYPAEKVSLRSVSAGRVALLDESLNYRMFEELEATSAPHRVYPGAIYLHQGEPYLIRHLDLEMGIAHAAPAEVDYYTEPRETNRLTILETTQQRRMPASEACFGRLWVGEQVIGFRRIRHFDDKLISVEPLDMPEQHFQTMGLWFEVPSPAMRVAAQQGLDVAGGLHAIEHAAIGILPLFAMCDRLDIGGLSTTCHPSTDRAEVFIYDAYPGGIGIAEKGFDVLPELWRATLRAIVECPCQDGCPSCIQSPKCGSNNEPLDKAAAVAMLRFLLGGSGEG